MLTMRPVELEETVENMGYARDAVFRQSSSFTTTDVMSSLLNDAKSLKNTLTFAFMLVLSPLLI